MKNNLGSILFLLLSTMLAASTDLAEFSLSTNKKEAFIKEAVEITFTAKQKDHTDVMFFFLTPHKSDDYEIKLLNKKTTHLSYHNYTTTFTYLLFPLKAKKLSVDFDFTIKVASDKAVAQVYEGSRDNTKWIDTTDTTIDIKPIYIDAKKHSQHVDLVGDFTLTSKLLKDEITQYDAANISYRLNGSGYKDESFELIDTLPDVKIFKEKTDAYAKATKEGYKINREYAYAFVSKKSFTIPEIVIDAYSPTKKEYYTISAKAQDITVTTIDPATLIDDKEFPKEQKRDLTLYKNIFYAVLLFMAGYLSAHLVKSIDIKRKAKKFDDIKQAESAKKLILVLLQNYKTEDVKQFIDELELLEYKKGDKSLKEIKADILKVLRAAS
ncbi:MAG: hypothetical protein ABXS93_01160 [Sulfurimonas sp.]